MPTFDPAPPDVLDFIVERTQAMYPELAKYEVKIGALMAYPTGPGPTLKHHGYPCAAIIRVVSHRDRAAGGPDAQIQIDDSAREGWKTWSYEERCSNIEHELHHVELRFDKEGRLVTDKGSRPRIKLKLHDYNISGFRAIAERHGEHSLEVKMARAFATECGQLLFGWAEPGKTARRAHPQPREEPSPSVDFAEYREADPTTKRDIARKAVGEMFPRAASV